MRETDSMVGDAELRARYRMDGYILLRGLLSRDEVRRLGQEYLRRYAAAARPLPPYGVARHPAFDFVRTPEFRRFVDRPLFQRLAERVTGTAMTPIRRTPLRHFPKGVPVASRAHIDGTYIEGEPADIVTIWTPLIDCAVTAGSLMYLEGSHRDADLVSRVRPGAPRDRAEDVRPITHDLRWLADATARSWAAADFAAGDVVVHSPTIVHATLDATTAPRLSADIRFRRVDGPRDPRWDNDWSADDGY